eukprot:364681-Chlamydomonas_euryale.AAC.10
MEKEGGEERGGTEWIMKGERPGRHEERWGWHEEGGDGMRKEGRRGEGRHGKRGGGEGQGTIAK